ncbi:MAG: DNA polymerase III subunit beta [Gammaproteobacteria bacterium]|nr:DNA polymerase III subunit beta [Gammaproteobacteria bacterium]
MKFTIQRETFLKPLQHVTGVVERRSTMPILANILIKAKGNKLNLTATDLEVELSSEVETEIKEEGEITVPARKLLDICRTLPEGANLNVSQKDDHIIIRSAKSRFSLSCLPATDFPIVENIVSAKSFVIAQEDLKSVIESTHFSMAQQDVRYYLNGLMFELSSERLRTVATDGHRLALGDFEIAIDDVEEPYQVIVPRKGIQELLRLLEEGEAKVEIGSNHIRIYSENTRFTSKLIDGRFPDYQRVVPKGGDKNVIVERDILRQALTRTSILSNEKYKGIRFLLESGLLKIQAHNPEQEEAEEEIEIDYQGESLEIGFNVTYLLDALSAVTSDQVQMILSDTNSSCLVKSPVTEAYKYVVMPMRL